MSMLTWDKDGERLYETGVSRGVAYPFYGGRYQNGVAWNGLTAVNESPSGGEPEKLYADNSVYIVLTSAEEYAFGIEAYTCPDEMKPCLGKDQIADGVFISQQDRRFFGFCYRSEVGSDTKDIGHDYKLHVIFKCFVSPSSPSHETTNNNPDIQPLSWDVSAIPVQVDADRRTAVLTIDSMKMQSSGLMNVLRAIEDRLYGTSSSDPEFTTIRDILDLFSKHRYLCDSTGNHVLDSSGGTIESGVYE